MPYPEFRKFSVKLTGRKYLWYDVVESENEWILLKLNLKFILQISLIYQVNGFMIVLYPHVFRHHYTFKVSSSCMDMMTVGTNRRMYFFISYHKNINCNNFPDVNCINSVYAWFMNRLRRTRQVSLWVNAFVELIMVTSDPLGLDMWSGQ